MMRALATRRYRVAETKRPFRAAVRPTPGQREKTASRPGSIANAANTADTEAAVKVQTRVRVWLFGALSALSPERPMVLEFTSGFTARQVIEAMAVRCGPALPAQALDETGSLLRCCRLFVDGFPVEDLDLPLGADGPSVEIEMILLMGYEGG